MPALSALVVNGEAAGWKAGGFALDGDTCRIGGVQLRFQRDGLPVGIADDPDYRDETVVLNSGDRIFLYSDGVLEAENSQGNYFGSAGLIECVDAPEVSLNDAVNSIEEKVLNWCNGQPKDDISILAMSMFDRES